MLTRTLDNQVIYNHPETVVTVSFDICGNCYLSTQNSYSLYQINIDNKDEIYLEQEVYNSSGMTKLVPNKIIQIEKGKDKIVNNNENEEEKEEEDEEQEQEQEQEDMEESEEDYSEEDSDKEEMEMNAKELAKKNKLIRKLFPEQIKYRIESSDNNKKSKKKFSFASTKNKIKIHKKDTCETLALYESLVYDESFSVIFTSTADNYVLYRLNVYHDGRLVFRPIGGVNKHYAVTLKDGVPSLFRI